MRAEQLPAQLYSPRCRSPWKQQRCISAGARSNRQSAPGCWFGDEGEVRVGAKTGCDRSSGRARVAPGRHLHPRAIAAVSRRGLWCRPTRNALRHRARLLDRRPDTGVRRLRRQGSSASFTVGCRGRWRAAPARSMRKRASRGRVRCWANGAEWPRASKAIERRAEGGGECGRGGEALLPGRPRERCLGDRDRAPRSDPASPVAAAQDQRVAPRGDRPTGLEHEPVQPRGAGGVDHPSAD